MKTSSSHDKKPARRSELAELVALLQAAGVTRIVFLKNRMCDTVNFAELPARIRYVVNGCVSHTDGTSNEDAAERCLAELQSDEGEYVPTCRLCDAVGHGYPGGGPCPLEMTAEPLDPREEEADRLYEEEMEAANWRAELAHERATLGGAW